MADMVRVNTRIPADVNAWLDKQTEKTGVPKSTQIHLALEQYIYQKEAMQKANDIGELIKALERYENLAKGGGIADEKED